MASFSVTRVFNFSFFSPLFFISMVIVSISSFQFEVDGEAGSNPLETRRRYTMIGLPKTDSMSQNDTVLHVNKEDYENCIISNPISKFEDGNTVFCFDRYGFFYFINGQLGHCKAGQKVVIRVKVHPEVEPSKTAALPKASGNGTGGGPRCNGWDSNFWGPYGLSSATKLSVASYSTTVLRGMLVILYLFM